jgi:hypothetical protein
MDELQRLAAFLYGFAPRSALVCAIEGDPPGSGGAPPTAPPPAAPATQPTTSAPTFTQADIDAAKQQAYNAGAAEVRRALEGKQKQPAAQQPPKPEANTAAPSVDVRTEITRIRSFERAAGAFGLSAEALEILETDFHTANPPDPAAWVQTRAKAFGWKAPGQPSTPPATAATTATPPSAPQGAPVTSTAAPASTTVVTDDTPIIRLSEADRGALLKRIGIKAYTDRMFSEFRASGTRVSFRR